MEDYCFFSILGVIFGMLDMFLKLIVVFIWMTSGITIQSSWANAGILCLMVSGAWSIATPISNSMRDKSNSSCKKFILQFFFMLGFGPLLAYNLEKDSEQVKNEQEKKRWDLILTGCRYGSFPLIVIQILASLCTDHWNILNVFSIVIGIFDTGLALAMEKESVKDHSFFIRAMFALFCITDMLVRTLTCGLWFSRRNMRARFLILIYVVESIYVLTMREWWQRRIDYPKDFLVTGIQIFWNFVFIEKFLPLVEPDERKQVTQEINKNEEESKKSGEEKLKDDKKVLTFLFLEQCLRLILAITALIVITPGVPVIILLMILILLNIGSAFFANCAPFNWDLNV